MKVKLVFTSLLLVLVLVLGTLAGCITVAGPTPATEPAATTMPAVQPTTPAAPINPSWTPPATSNETEALPSIADVVALVKPSVVAISTEVIGRDFFNRPYTQEGAGSGWILDKNGIIVTNNHVVEGATSITVTLDDGRNFTADVDSIATDSLNDLAILKIDADGLTALKLGDITRLRTGDWVVAIGNALGQGIRATEGIISRKDVALPVSEQQTLYDLLETSAAINPGNSGGPLVNLAGEVVGITSAKVAQVGVEGMGYAIGINTAIPIVQELVNRGYVLRPWLGVGLYTVDQIAVAQLKLAVDKGVLLVQVNDGSPAARAGLEPGDVIVRIGDEDVTTVNELTRVLHASEIGKPLDLVVWHGKEQKTVSVVPAESPADS